MSEGNVLVVDDEEYIRDLVSSALRLAGFTTRTAAGGHEALAVIGAEQPDLVILDIAMPNLDGYEVCRRLREAGDLVPVIFLTARDAAEDRVRGFAQGGDDYVIKPFGLEELVARVRAVLRRARSDHGPVSDILRCADLELDERSLSVTKGGRPIQLSPTELKLLRYLLINQGQVVSRAQILTAVWEDEVDGSSGVVENYISYLRKKLDDDEEPLIQTVRGFGYILRRAP